ncbi:MAG TPA: tetratricopeptide repeat protein, partial [Methanomassiliicoccales archaeon]|nr:tetratricopeptide repeat protein [Methanomassiliicoccales archaeon]
MESTAGVVPMENLTKARDQLTEVSVDPNLGRKQEFSDAYVRLSDLFLRGGNATDASLAADNAMRLVPGSVPAVIARAKAASASGKVEEAIRAIDWALNQNPSDKTLLVERGWVYDRAGNENGAVESWKRAAEVDPEDLSVLDLLANKSREKEYWLRKKGDAQMAKGTYAEAATTFDEALAGDPNNVEVLTEKGKAL